MEDKRPNSEGRARAIYRVTIGGSVCNFLLLLFKFVAGILGGSAAMLADAVHSLSDFVTDVVVILFVRISSKPCDADHDFGHGKYETLASVFIGLMLACVGIGILWSGAENRCEGGALSMDRTSRTTRGVFSSNSQCMAPPQRCPFEYWHGLGHRRCYTLRP